MEQALQSSPISNSLEYSLSTHPARDSHLPLHSSTLLPTNLSQTFPSAGPQPGFFPADRGSLSSFQGAQQSLSSASVNNNLPRPEPRGSIMRQQLEDFEPSVGVALDKAHQWTKFDDETLENIAALILNEYDKNNTGFIERNELQKVMRDGYEQGYALRPFDESDLDGFMALHDGDKDKK